MRVKDTSDVFASCVAVAADAIAVFAGFMFATWIRFNSGLISLFHDIPPEYLFVMYAKGAALATLLFLFIFQSLGLYIRPQIGIFSNKIPRIIHAISFGILLTIALAFAIRTEPPFSRATVFISIFTISFFVLLERYLLFRLELHLARHRKIINRVVVVGTNAIAVRLNRALQQEPRLGSKVIAFFQINSAENDKQIHKEMIKGTLNDLKSFIAANEADQLILTDTTISHNRMIEMILLCEQFMVTFNLVPDLFHVLTSSVDMQTIDDIPLLGVSRWPLDKFWNRLLKRMADIIGALIALVLFSPLMLICAVLIKRDSPGPVFFRQDRCGKDKTQFALTKFRTMRVDAEAETGPVLTVENDPRRTKIGAILRMYNLDEIRSSGMY